MSLLDDMISILDGSGDGIPGGGRPRAKESEIDARLDFYANTSSGFVVTDRHRDAARAIFCEGRNVFLTGGAGTGKTTFVKTVVLPELDRRGINWSVTAMTGIAGSHLSGKTLHSWAGIYKGVVEWPEHECDEPNPQEMTEEQLQDKYETFYARWARPTKPRAHAIVVRRIRSAEVLLIDEVSMCHGNGLLGFIDYLFKMVRNSAKPFGGIQMVLIGDFAQLPPVEQRKDIPRPDWAFMSRSWDDARVKTVELDRVFRQGDNRYIEFLHSIRNGEPVDMDYVRQFHRRLEPDDTKNYTFLVPVNTQADQLNQQALVHYEEPTMALDARFDIHDEQLREWEDIPEVKKKLVDSLRLVDKTLFLRVGCPVMFARNDPGGLFVNGTRGFLRAVSSDRNTVTVGVPTDDGERHIILGRWRYTMDSKQDPEDEMTVWRGESMVTIPRWPAILQFPLIPATALTIHKSQGASMDAAILALTETFAPGHVYVALSRLRSPKGLVIINPEFLVRTDPYVLAFYRSLKNDG